MEKYEAAVNDDYASQIDCFGRGKLNNSSFLNFLKPHFLVYSVQYTFFQLLLMRPQI